MATWRDRSSTGRTGAQLETTYTVDTNYADAGTATNAARTTYFQNLLDDAQTTSGVIEMPPGYEFTVTGLTTDESFQQPSIRGLGGRQSAVLKGSGSSPILKFVGGSGGLCGAHLSDFTLSGASAIGIEIAGAGGITATNLRFGGDAALATGVRFHNEAASTFTEFNVFRDCHFEDDCTTHIEYKRTSGNDSFHGSGFENCVFVQDAADSGPKILVGANCKVYNAPWSGHFFGTADGVSLIEIASSLDVTAFGNLCVELAGSVEMDLVDSGSNAGLLLAGHIVELNNGLTLYPLARLVDRAVYNSDESLSVALKPFQAAAALTTGDNEIPLAESGTYRVDIRITGTDYEHWHALYVYRSPFDTGGDITDDLEIFTFDDASYGAPTFDVDNSSLVISNALYPASGVSARFTVSQGVANQNFPMT